MNMMYRSSSKRKNNYRSPILRNKLKILRLDITYSEMTCSLSKVPLNEICKTTKRKGEKIILVRDVNKLDNGSG